MKTILVVDDDKKINLMLTLMLRRNGFNVFRVTDALGAHQLLKNGNKVDLILLDINMPDLPGDEFNQVIQSFHYKTKVIVCSVLPVEEQARRIPDAVEYYDKSESFASLMNKIDDVFKRHEGVNYETH